MILAGLLLFFFGASTAIVIGETFFRDSNNNSNNNNNNNNRNSNNNNRWCIHASVAFAIFPLAALITLGFAVSSQQLVEYLQTVARSEIIPSFVSKLLLFIRPIDTQLLNLLDVQLVAILLYVCYASMLIIRHLVDIVRALKISRRRLNMK